MTGCRNGVVARLKEKASSAIGIHCAAHRVNLTSTQAAAGVPYVKNLTTSFDSCNVQFLLDKKVSKRPSRLQSHSSEKRHVEVDDEVSVKVDASQDSICECC